MHTATEMKDEIDQVREIVVGAIQRDLERRIARVETNLTARVNELQQEARRRAQVIEEHMGKETESLSTRVAAEIAELKEGLRAAGREQRECASALETRLAKMEDTIARAQHDLRKQILDQAKSFLDEIHRTREELAEAIERELRSFEVEPAEELPSREPTGAESRPSP